MIEMMPRLIGREDEDVSAAIKDILEAEGIMSGSVPTASALPSAATV